MRHTGSGMRHSGTEPLRQSTGVVSDSFFESDRTASEAVGSVVYDKIQLKRTAQTINYIVGSVGTDRTASEAVGSVVYDEIQLKRTAQTINYIVGSVGNR